MTASLSLLDGAAAYRIRFWRQPLHGRKVACRRCGVLAWGSRTSSGKLCEPCATEAEIEALPGLIATADRLAVAYGLPEHERGSTARTQLIETMADTSGQVRVTAPSTGPKMRLRWHPDARRLADSLPKHQVGLQARTVGRVLWALSLQVAAPDLVALYVADKRGGHYHPDEIPWAAVAWGRQSSTSAWWLHRYARTLAGRYRSLYGREHNSVSHDRLVTYRNSIDVGQLSGALQMLGEVSPLPPAALAVALDGAQHDRRDDGQDAAKGRTAA